MVVKYIDIYHPLPRGCKEQGQPVLCLGCLGFKWLTGPPFCFISLIFLLCLGMHCQWGNSAPNLRTDPCWSGAGHEVLIIFFVTIINPWLSWSSAWSQKQLHTRQTGSKWAKYCTVYTQIDNLPYILTLYRYIQTDSTFCSSTVTSWDYLYLRLLWCQQKHDRTCGYTPLWIGTFLYAHIWFLNESPGHLKQLMLFSNVILVVWTCKWSRMLLPGYWPKPEWHTYFKLIMLMFNSTLIIVCFQMSQWLK